MTAETSVSDATRTPPSESWDVLRDAGGAWMDDSLQLSEPRLSPAPTPPARPAERFDPEVTLDAKALASAPDAPPDPRAAAALRPGPAVRRRPPQPAVAHPLSHV